MVDRSPRHVTFDITLAVVFATVAVLQVVLGVDGYDRGPVWLELALALSTTLPLALRRVRPVAVVVAVFAPQIVVSAITPHMATFWGTLLPMTIALYSCVRYALPRIGPALAVLLLPLAFCATYGLHVPSFRTLEDYAFGAIVFGAAWASGRVIRHLVTQRAALRHALGQLEDQAEQRRRQVLLEERARIAREMHDVVAHGVSVMVVQAASARLELGAADDAARDSLLAVEETGRRVLDELRRTIVLLRDGDDGGDARPAPGLDDIPRLVETMRSAGLTVDLTVDTTAADDPGRGLAAYRVVQEALTNALRHAGPTSVQVRVTGDRDLDIEVRNAGPAAERPPGVAATEGGGHGLVGVAERVEMYGGTLTIDRGDGDFAVRAVIPGRASAS
ncbi:sensor histidine kinase [Agromyces sp. GXQ0307]|uniref:sensor histidine kinase n=1 Tax=Agromyces sp. GXQ0307 TaxID=3377835 RepID=UPI00383AE3EF